MTDHVAYTSSIKTRIVRWNFKKKKKNVLPRVDTSHVYVHAWALGCFHSHISTQTFRRVLTVSVDSHVEIKSAPLVA